MLEQILESLNAVRESATVERVFGKPIEVGEKTIIPVAEIKMGGGFGFGRGGAHEEGGEGQEQDEAEEGEGGGGGGGITACPRMRKRKRPHLRKPKSVCS